MDLEPIWETLRANAALAPWITFGALVLAGFSIPISIDALLLGLALFCATTAPEMAIPCFFAFWIGACCSSAIAYWLARLLGSKLLEVPFMAKIVSQEKLTKISSYFERYGTMTLFVGRFIPFGIRSCIFWSCGLSKMPFFSFWLRDIGACFVWSALFFALYYELGTLVQDSLAAFKWPALGLFVLLKGSLIFWMLRKSKAQKERAL